MLALAGESAGLAGDLFGASGSVSGRFAGVADDSTAIVGAADSCAADMEDKLRHKVSNGSSDCSRPTPS